MNFLIDLFGKEKGLTVLCYLIYCMTKKINRKKIRKNRLLGLGCLKNLPRFLGARPDHVRVDSSSCGLPRELAVGGALFAVCNL